MMRLRLIAVFLLFTTVVFGQKDWKTYEKDEYSIQYPKNWKIDTSGQMGASFILFSEIEENETFRENVNLLVQDLKGQNYTMESYVELSKNQIKTMVPNSTLIESKYIESSEPPYHLMVWKGHIGENDLQLKQHLYLIEEKAYILSFTALPNTYDRFLTLADEILNSFEIENE